MGEKAQEISDNIEKEKEAIGMKLVRFKYKGREYEVDSRRISLDPRLKRFLRYHTVSVHRKSIPIVMKTIKLKTPKVKSWMKKRRFIHKRRLSRRAIMKTRAITPLEIEHLKRMAEKHGIERDLIDWKSYIDRSLTFSENKRIVEKMLLVPSLSYGGEKENYIDRLFFKSSSGNHRAKKELKWLKKMGWW